MLTAVTHNSQKVGKSQMPPSAEWISKMWYFYTMTILKGNEVLTYATTQMNLH